MNTLQRYYNRKMSDYDIMRSCLSAGRDHAEWKHMTGKNTPEDWKEKHQAWITEPLKA